MKSLVSRALLAIVVLACGCIEKQLTPLQQVKFSVESGNWQAAIDAATPLIAEDPTSVVLLTYRGKSFLALGDYQAAVQDFTTIVDLNPTDPEGYYLRQLAFTRAGEIELADADGRQARELDSNYQSAYPFEPSNFRTERVILSSRADDEMEGDEEFAKDDDRRDEQVVENEGDGTSLDDNRWGDDPYATDDVTQSAVASKTDEPLEQAPTDKSRPSATNLPAVVKAPAAPKAPETPQAPQGPVADPSAEEANPNDFQQEWLADDQLIKPAPNANASRDKNPPEEDEEAKNPLNLPPVLPPLSTSLPPARFGGTLGGMPAAPGVVTPRSTGISSYRPQTNSIGIPGIVSGAPTTGLPTNYQIQQPYSTGTPLNNQYGPQSANQPGTIAGGAVPGQFLGNTIHEQGTTPSLTTSLPGARPLAPVTGPQPLTTQLPPDRMIQTVTPRPTGIMSNALPR